VRRPFTPTICRVVARGDHARGDHARGDHAHGDHAHGNVDLLVRFMDKENISLFDYIGYKNDLEKILKRKVDLVSEGTLHKFA
jgi:predicted nucleotidyltransferase